MHLILFTYKNLFINKTKSCSLTKVCCIKNSVVIDVIRKIGGLSQKGINPNDVMLAYESGETKNIENLYRRAKRLVLLQELYKELCFEYSKMIKETSGTKEQFINSNRSNKK